MISLVQPGRLAEPEFLEKAFESSLLSAQTALNQKVPEKQEVLDQ